MVLRFRPVLCFAGLLGGMATSSVAFADSVASAGVDGGLSGGDVPASATASGSAIYASAAVGASDLLDLYDDLTKAPVEASKSKAAARGDNAPVALMLDVTINGTPLPDIAIGELTSAGDLILPEAFWAAARLRRPTRALKLANGTTGYALGSVPALNYSLSLAQMTLIISAPADSFMAEAVDMRKDRSALPEQAPPGGYLNYDISITRSSSGSLNYGGLLDAVLFTGGSSLVARTVFRGSNHAQDLQVVRTETYWQKDLPDKMVSIVVGDATSSEGGWSQPVRYGGVRIGRNFRLAPSFITFPLPSISGSAALPSTIDLLVNNITQQSNIKVTPGAFDIRNLPVVTGAGDINLVVTDLRGVQNVLTRNYYSSSELLTPGLSDFSFEAGALRREFGLKSNQYGAGFVAASWRQGVTQWLTVQGRGELQRERQAAGGEVVLKLGSVGLARGAASYSSGRLWIGDGASSGAHYLVGFERISRKGSFTVEWEHFDEGFERFGNYASVSKPRELLRVGGGLSPFRGVSLGVSYIDQRSWAGDRFRILSANAGVVLPNGFNLSVFAADLMSKKAGLSFGINLTKALGPQRSASVSLNRSNNGNYSKRLAVSQSAPIGPGMGWNIEASDDIRQELRTGFTLNTNALQVNVDAAFSDTSMVRVGANGSVGWMKGLAFASRYISDHSFAVVEVGDLAGVRVYRANQYAATTNRKGKALVTGLLPYEDNRISLDADQLPLNVEIGGTDETAKPYARSGIFIKFPVKRSLNAFVKLRTSSGEDIPVGASVYVDDGLEFMVGHRGEAYLTGLGSLNTLDIKWPEGKCGARLSIDPAAADGSGPIPVVCE